jgi:hypothetical protein
LCWVSLSTTLPRAWCALTATNFLPSGAGIQQDGVGWQPTYTGCPANASTSFYVTVDVSSLGFRGVQKIYQERVCTDGALTSVLYFPILTAIVHVDQGVVNGISWDNGCYFCQTDSPECVLDAYNPATLTKITDSEFKGCSRSSTQCSGDECDLKVGVFCEKRTHYASWFVRPLFSLKENTLIVGFPPPFPFAQWLLSWSCSQEYPISPHLSCFSLFPASTSLCTAVSCVPCVTLSTPLLRCMLCGLGQTPRGTTWSQLTCVSLAS